MEYLFGIILAFASLITWAVSDVITKISLDHTSKWKVLFISQLFGGVIILILALLLGEISKLLSLGIYYLIFLGVLNLFGMYTFYKAMKKKGVALTTPIIYSWAFLAVILGVIFYNESLTFLQALSILLIILGIFLVTNKGSKHIFFDKTFFFAIASMIIWGVFYFLLKIPNLIFGAIIVTASIKLFTSFSSIPILLKKKINLFETKHKIMLFIMLVGFLDAFGFLAFNYAVNYAPVSIVAPICSATPALGVLLGVLLLKENILKKQYIGIAVVLAGLVLISI